jgi:hypothetical protein
MLLLLLVRQLPLPPGALTLLLLLLHTKSSQLLVLLSDGPSVLLRLLTLQLLLLPSELSPANDARTAPQPPSLLVWLPIAPAPPPLLLPLQELPSYDSRNNVTLPACCGVTGAALPCSSLETW